MPYSGVSFPTQERGIPRTSKTSPAQSFTPGAHRPEVDAMERDQPRAPVSRWVNQSGRNRICSVRAADSGSSLR